jgi:hypothetical protein
MFLSASSAEPSVPLRLDDAQPENASIRQQNTIFKQTRMALIDVLLLLSAGQSRFQQITFVFRKRQSNSESKLFFGTSEKFARVNGLAHHADRRACSRSGKTIS